jgi:hypothetical protein
MGTTPVFVPTHARDAYFERSLQAFFAYREPGHSEDVVLREVVLPGDFQTREVTSIKRGPN